MIYVTDISYDILCVYVCVLPTPKHTQKMSSVDVVVASFACNAAKVSDRYTHTSIGTAAAAAGLTSGKPKHNSKVN